MGLLCHERGISTLGQQLGFARELDTIAGMIRDRGDARPDLLTGLGRGDARPDLLTGLGRAPGDALWRTQHAGRDGAGEAGPEALTYKHEWSNWHRALGELAMDAMGPEGPAWSDDAERAALQHMYLFARSETIYGGTNEVQINIIAERGLGMPREPRGKA